MVNEQQRLYESWSKRHANYIRTLDRENVTITRIAPVWWRPLSIVYNGLEHDWFIQRDRGCVAAWQLKSRSPWGNL